MLRLSHLRSLRQLRQLSGITLINEKLEKAQNELNYIKDSLSRRNDSGTDNTAGSTKVLEDGADTAEKNNNINKGTSA